MHTANLVTLVPKKINAKEEVGHAIIFFSTGLVSSPSLSDAPKVWTSNKHFRGWISNVHPMALGENYLQRSVKIQIPLLLTSIRSAILISTWANMACARNHMSFLFFFNEKEWFSHYLYKKTPNFYNPLQLWLSIFEWAISTLINRWIRTSSNVLRLVNTHNKRP